MSSATLGVIKIGLDPVLFRLGSISVHWYGLMYVVGLATALYVTMPYAARRGIDRNRYYDIFWPVVVASVVGGRLYYVVQSNLGWYIDHPDKILATWEGGMAFYGAVFLGVVAALAACLWKRVSFAIVLDVAALFVPLAQAIGRIGNLVNGDIVGYPSTLPWATQYTNPANTFVASHSVAYDPAAAYELLFSLILFFVLWRLRFRFEVPGTLFALWIVGYSIGQFFLFFDRANIVVALGLKQAQLTSVAVLVIALPAWWLWNRYWERTRQLNDRADGQDAASLTEAQAGA